MRRRRALLGATLALFVVVALLFAFGYPIRTLLDQRSQIGAAHRHLDGLQRATAALDRQSRQLTGDAEVERIARERYGLVRPGETPYVLVPVAPTTTVPTTVPPTSPPTTRP